MCVFIVRHTLSRTSGVAQSSGGKAAVREYFTLMCHLACGCSYQMMFCIWFACIFNDKFYSWLFRTFHDINFSNRNNILLEQLTALFVKANIEDRWTIDLKKRKIWNLGSKIGHSSGSIPFEITCESGPIRPVHSRRLDCHKLFHVSQ